MTEQAALKRNSLSQALAEIAELLGDRLSLSHAVREQHGKDLTWDPGGTPDAVAFVDSGDEVRSVVKICAKYQVPVVPYGTGTSLEGHIAATRGGVSIDTSHMNNIIQVNAEDLDCRVEPGVTRKQLNSYLRDTGLFFPIDPGADASIGGMAATRASGTNAVRYGTMRENVLSLKVVMANGDVVRTASRAKKSSAGYDLTRLFVGSEGTLGVITEITLRLHGIPQSIVGGVCPFPSVEAACNAVIATIQMGIPVARIELADEVQVKACNAYSKLSLKEQPTLFLEFHGSEAGTREQSESFGEIAAEYGGGPFEWTAHEEDRQKLWQARHDVYYACLAMRPGCKAFATDVCVPISRLAECVGEAKRDLEANNLTGPIVGHVGDGNFHVSVLIDPADEAEIARAKAFYERLILRAIAMDGTCTGEHGVGRGKMRFLEAEHGAGLKVMRAIKIALDPDDIMNPDKIVAL